MTTRLFLVTKHCSRSHLLISAWYVLLLCLAHARCQPGPTSFLACVQVDPEGVRTVGVLTKLDLVGAGAEEEVVDILDNVRKPLNLGYVGVRCRSAADLKTNMTLATAVSEERIFFETHPVFSRLRPDVRGVQTLTTKLTRVLVSRIRDAVPTMAAEVASQLKLTDEAMAALGGPPPATRAAQHEFFVTRVRIFAHLLSAAVSARYDDEVFDNPALRVCTAAADAYDACARQVVKELRPPFEDAPYLAKIESEVASSRGLALPCFPDVSVFDKFVRQTAAQWKDPAMDCREAVVQVLRGTVRSLVDHVFGKYPALSARMVGVAEELVDDVSAKCAEVLERILMYECLQPHTLNPSFMRSVNQQRKSFLEKLIDSTEDLSGLLSDETDGSDQKRVAVVGKLEGLLESPTEILNALRAFWMVSSVRFVDYVAMAVRHEVLEGGCRRITEAFYVALADLNLPSLFTEDGRLFDRRVALEAKHRRLRSAQTAMRKLHTT